MKVRRKLVLNKTTNTSFIVLLLLLAVTTVSSISSSTSVTFQVFDNGSSQDGIEVTMIGDEFPTADTPEEIMELFAIQMSHVEGIVVHRHGQQPGTVVATKAFREDGERITSFDQLLPPPPAVVAVDENKEKTNDKKDGDDEDDENEDDTGEIRMDLRRIYLVAEGLEFMWPFVRYGHLQILSSRALTPPEDKPIVLESMSDSPRVFRIMNFFSHDESEFLIDHATKHLARSTVGNANDKAHARADAGRTSENAWDGSTYVAKRMITRSFNLTRIVEDVGKIDGLQIVRYLPGQFYNEHPDYFTPGSDKYFDFSPYSGGSNRFATVFMYINDVEEGGCTVFPRTSSPNPTKPPQYSLDMFKKYSMEYHMVTKCHTKLAVPPQQGTAALFYSSTPDGRVDPMSHHGACPVIKGIKWGANIWIWNRQRFGDIKTGLPRPLKIHNTLNVTIYLSWEGREDGTIAPNQVRHEQTFEFHRFKVHLNSHKDPTMVEYTVQTEPKDPLWIIERPRLLVHNKNGIVVDTKIQRQRRQQILLEGAGVIQPKLRGANEPDVDEDPEHSEDL